MKAALGFLKAYGLLLAGALVLAVIAGGFLAGFRLGPGLSLMRLGTLLIRDLPAGSYVYTDEINRAAPDAAGASRIGLLPGTHSVIVDSPGNQPWNELFTVRDATTTELHPVFVPVKVESVPLTGDDAAKAGQLIWQTALPSKDAPLLLAGGCAAVYANGNQIIAEATSTAGCVPPEFLCAGGSCAPTISYSTAEILRSILPFPGRTDALVVASGGLLYVIELDPREPQFFAPLFKGAFVKAASWSDSSIVASDGARTFEIPISPK